MKLNISNLREVKKITVTGDEGWLKTIYDTFHSDANSKVNKLKAELIITPVGDGFTMVKGEISYTPIVDCSRCGDFIPWSIEDRFEVCFQKEDVNDEQLKERELSAGELDEYYLDGDDIDIELLLNERVQLAIPMRTVLAREDKENECFVCGDDLDEARVIGVSPENDENNPFHALKHLKKPKN